MFIAVFAKEINVTKPYKTTKINKNNFNGWGSTGRGEVIGGTIVRKYCFWLKTSALTFSSDLSDTSHSFSATSRSIKALSKPDRILFKDLSPLSTKRIVKLTCCWRKTES